MVSAFVRDQLQNADTSHSQPARLPAGCIAGLRSVHDFAAAGCAIKNALLPRRRPLGVEAAEFPALVQDGERLGGPVGGEINHQHFAVARKRAVLGSS